ncbi:MAG: hypothetical protein GEU78_15430 [Actinobacteria bacterium]|nr:hypothetical protein [Actinomycetota bacterium]
MDRSAPVGWPPTPEEAPTFDDVMSVLEELLTRGTDIHRRAQDAYRINEPEEWESLDMLHARLQGEDLALLMRYEARSNVLCALWAEDRFRIGFALGASAARMLGTGAAETG